MESSTLNQVVLVTVVLIAKVVVRSRYALWSKKELLGSIFATELTDKSGQLPSYWS